MRLSEAPVHTETNWLPGPINQPTSSFHISMLSCQSQWARKTNSSLAVWQDTITGHASLQDEAIGTLFEYSLLVSVRLITANIHKIKDADLIILQGKKKFKQKYLIQPPLCGFQPSKWDKKPPNVLVNRSLQEYNYYMAVTESLKEQNNTRVGCLIDSLRPSSRQCKLFELWEKRGMTTCYIRCILHQLPVKSFWMLKLL